MALNISKINTFLFCLSLLSINFPVKIYPLFFLISSISFFIENRKILLHPWLYFLIIYSVYAISSFIISGNYTELRITNFYKILVNFTFLISVTNWLRNREVDKLIVYIDYLLKATFILVFIQLFLYHRDSNFQYVFGASNSNEGTDIYNTSLYFWGLDNKNLFGARIATIGFPFVLVGAIRYNKISISRILYVLILAFLSMSRTPLIALFVGILSIIWNMPGKIIKVTIFSFLIAVTPILAQSVIRIDTITESSDGMGIRLMYWAAFFTNFDKISIFGNGFLAADSFLDKYALFYLGEPNIHNTFLNNYLDFGIIGLVSYVGFLIGYYKYGLKFYYNRRYWVTAFLPLITTMMVLFPGYDNDIIVYLILIFIIGKSMKFDFSNLQYSII